MASAGTGFPRCFEYSVIKTEASSILQHQRQKEGHEEAFGGDNYARYLACGGGGTGVDISQHSSDCVSEIRAAGSI